MRRTILLADDSPTIRRLVTHTFAEGDFRIVEVNNGDAAIKTFEELRPSVVLADIYMPGKNGYQVCAYVRSHKELHRTPVVLLVGAFEAFDEDTAKQAGATASITKPFEPAALIDLVTSILAAEDAPVESGPVSEQEPAAAVPPPPLAPAPAPAAATTTATMPAPALKPTLAPKPAPVPKPTPAPKPVAVLQTVSEPVKAAAAAPPESEDLLGLESIFEDEPTDEPQTSIAGSITEQDIDRIADRVIKKLSTQVIESIAWDILPDITEKIVRQELKRIDEN